MSDGLAFGCTFQSLDGVACLTLNGDLDLATVDTFRAHLAIAVHRGGPLLLDVTGLRYLDSTGINALLGAHRDFPPSGRRIALAGASRNVRRILSVLDLEAIVPVFASVDEALAYLRSSGESERAAAES